MDVDFETLHNHVSINCIVTKMSLKHNLGFQIGLLIDFDMGVSIFLEFCDKYYNSSFLLHIEVFLHFCFAAEIPSLHG